MMPFLKEMEKMGLFILARSHLQHIASLPQKENKDRSTCNDNGSLPSIFK
jgi:hypothetical protein